MNVKVPPLLSGHHSSWEILALSGTLMPARQDSIVAHSRDTVFPGACVNGASWHGSPKYQSVC